MTSRIMKLVVLGATGPTGQCAVTQALEAGHEVTAVVRNPAKMTTKHDKLKVVEGDIFSETSLQPHFEGQDAVVSCLGSHAGWLQPITFYSQSIKPIIDAMKGSKVNKFVTITTWCTKDEGPFIMKWILKPLLLKQICIDMDRMEEFLKQESGDIKYIVAKPPGLGGNSISGKEIKAVEGQWVPGGSHSINRGDLAKFMLSCLDTDQWDNKLVRVVIHEGRMKYDVWYINGKVVEGDIFSKTSLQPHFEGQDAVLSCLGFHTGWLQPITFYSDSIKPIIAAMKGAKVNRFIVMTAWCTKNEGPFVVQWIVKPFFLKQYAIDWGRMEDFIEQECGDIKYTVVKPPDLKGADITGKEIKRVEGQWVPGGPLGITRGDVAKFMLSCLDTDQWNDKLVAISY